MSKRLGLKKWTVLIYPLALALSFSAAVAQQPAKQAQPPMPLGVAWQNVNAACAVASDEILTGKQGRALRESLTVLQKALVIYEQYTTGK